MIDVYVIGCGGIGGYLVDRLPMVISSLSLDLLYSDPVELDKALRSAGTMALKCVVDRLVLVDGDVFNPRNALRQGAGAGGKLVQRMRRLKDEIADCGKASEIVSEAMSHVDALRRLCDGTGAASTLRSCLDILRDERHVDLDDMRRMQAEMLRVSFLRNMELVGYDCYVTPSTIDEIIPVDRPRPIPTDVGSGFRSRANASVVFVCVDNVQTRWEIQKHCERFRDCLMVNGGNSRTQGHVTLYERSSGVELDPPLYEVYPDIRPGVDKRPDELECTAVAPKHDQIAVTNALVADVMLARFVQWTRAGLGTGAGQGKRYNEIMVDISQPSVIPLYHPRKNN